MSVGFKAGDKLVYKPKGSRYTRAAEFVRMSKSGGRAKIKLLGGGWLEGTHTYVKLETLRKQAE